MMLHSIQLHIVVQFHMFIRRCIRENVYDEIEFYQMKKGVTKLINEAE